LTWAKAKTDNRNEKQNTICSIMQQKTLLMMDVMSKNAPFELVFESKYGKIIDYNLFGDGYIVLGFSEGYVVHISTHIKELSSEVQSEKIFSGSLDALTTNDYLYKLAVAGEG
jgi:WD repeat-containing protein 19